MPKLRSCWHRSLTSSLYKTCKVTANLRRSSCRGNAVIPCEAPWPLFAKIIVRIILDASARRFQAHKIYQRMAAARRWAMSRAQVLQGQRPSSRHTAALAALDDTLRTVRKKFSPTLFSPRCPCFCCIFDFYSNILS